MTEIVVTPWQINERPKSEIVELTRQLSGFDDKTAYDYKAIPAENDARWKEWKIGTDGKYSFNKKSRLSPGSRLKKIDFLYIQTFVTIPEGVNLNSFNVAFGSVDDGARVYIFNSDHPKGGFDEKADLVINGNQKSEDLKSLVKSGERNRVVVVQMDLCPPGNSFSDLRIEVDGTALTIPAAAEKTTTVKKEGAKPDNDNPDCTPPRPDGVKPRPACVVVRFQDSHAMQGTKAADEWIREVYGRDFEVLEARFGPLRLSPVFDVDDDLLQSLTCRAKEIDKTYETPNFHTFFYVEGASQGDLANLTAALLALPGVLSSYIDMEGPDPLVDDSNDVRAANQGYLNPSPDGIDAKYAWTIAGGDGAGQRFIDMERGWTLNHEDITDHGGKLLHGTLRDDSRSHGTSVLGEICAVDNTVGCVGIVPNIASFDVTSFHNSSRVAAILESIKNLSFGDVLLLEAQVYLNGTSLLGPIEAYDAEFEAIRLATALGVVVVQAGGNGTNNGGAPALNMNTWTNSAGKQIFNPSSPDFRDSGAIIVTAASSAAPHTRLVYGPHGDRIDCFAWGENIDTCRSNSEGSTDLYTTSFGGTSGASPIITGAALAVQGMVEASRGYRLSPHGLRAMLRDSAYGTAPKAGENPMGVMPDLKKIIDTALGVTPDLYLRDFVGDAGEPHSGSISASPDIILRTSTVADPQASFGTGSGTENSNTLGYNLERGNPNYLYTRVLNQGTAAASDVEVTLYWAEVSSLVTPDQWNLIGSTTIDSVPPGEVLTVSDAIVWSSNFPVSNHACIVGVIGTEKDPAPNPVDFKDFDSFRRFIRDNNNVTWRNFNVVDNAPDVEPEPFPGKVFKALPFLAPGPPLQAAAMQIEVISKLPPDCSVALEVPSAYADAIEAKGPNANLLREGDVAYLRAIASGRSTFPDVVHAARARHQMRLLVHVPEEHRGRAHEVAVRQLHKGEEVGRVTWLLSADHKGLEGFQIYKDRAGEWRWRMRSESGEIIAASSDGHRTEEECRDEVEKIVAICRRHS